jgi:predicted O-methyltransferase YrrM
MSTDDFQRTLRQVAAATRDVEGWLSRREAEFLTLLAGEPTTDGDVLEIGSFRGRSTIALALGMEYSQSRAGTGRSSLIAVDPMRDDDPLLEQALPAGSARAAFEANLDRAQVRGRVEFHQTYSYELARSWNRPLRLLWIDGDHRYAATKQDFDLFIPFLADGGILAMHDVLSRYDGCIRVFCEDVLSSPRVGAAGLCGSIGWAQFWNSARHCEMQERYKRQLHDRLRRLLPYHRHSHRHRGWAKLRYKWLRHRVPHGAVSADRWRRMMSRQIAPAT